MQDYNYNYAGCMEITMELNCCMFSPEGELEARWTENRDSLFAYIQQVHIGNFFLLYWTCTNILRNKLQNQNPIFHQLEFIRWHIHTSRSSSIGQLI